MDFTKKPLTQGNNFDVNARRPVNQDTPFDERLKKSKNLGYEEERQIKLDKRRENLRIKKIQARARAKIPNRYEESIVPDLSDKTTINQVVSIMDSRNPDAYVWYISTNQDGKYFKAGNYIKKHDFTQLGLERLGLYLPREDYPTFYNSKILVFYEFENAVFSDRDLVGKFFQSDKPSNYPNFDDTMIDTSRMEARKTDLDNKKQYVEKTRFFMKNAIIQYLNTKPWLNGSGYIPPDIRGYARDDDTDYSHTQWSQQIKKYIEFYVQIVPMVQRNLERNPNYNGNISSAIAQLNSLEEQVKNIMGSDFTLEGYMTGEYIDTIRQLLSPVVAEVRPPASAAPVIIPTAAGPSASAAPPASVLGSFGKYVPSIVSSAASGIGTAASGAASYLGDKASGAANFLGNAASYGVDSVANALRASTGFPQNPRKGMMFAKGNAPRYTPPVAKLSPADDMAVSNVYKDLELRRGEQADFYGNPNYHRSDDFRYQSNNDLMDTAKQIVGERKAAADAHEMSWGGAGKRKSKRKQRRSQKQKKSRKQRR